MQASLNKRSWLTGWACGLVTLVCVLIANARAEIGICDDWSYIFTAKRLAETGHIIYNGWATAALGPQLYLAAAFVRLFGFSFTVVRASTVCLFVLSAVLMYAILTRAGIRERNAVLGTLTVVLSPLYLPIATTFMSDPAAMFLVLLFFYACIRSASATDDRSRTGWIAGAAIAGLAAGSVRQIDFLCVLVALPALALHFRRRRKIAAVTVGVWIISCLAVLLIVRWFNSQSYVAVEGLIHLPKTALGLHLLAATAFTSLVSCLLLISPVLLAVAVRVPLRTRLSVFTLVAVAAFVGIVTHHFGAVWWGRWLVGGWVSVHGDIWRPVVLGPLYEAVPNSLLVFTAFFLVATVAFAIRGAWSIRTQRSRQSLSNIDRLLLSISIPFVAGYLVLVFTRAKIFDRYFLPILFLAVLGMLRWLERRGHGRVPLFVFVPVVAFALFAVAATHDMFAGARALVSATEELRSAGVPRTEIQDGWVYDGWTEIAVTGHVNEPRIRPLNAYHPVAVPAQLTDAHPATDPLRSCFFPFYSFTPSIHARFIMQSEPNFCFPNSAFPPVHYSKWLPPHLGSIYIASAPATLP